MKYAQPYDADEAMDIAEDRETRRHGQQPDPAPWPWRGDGPLPPAHDLPPVPDHCPDCMKSATKCLCYIGGFRD